MMPVKNRRDLKLAGRLKEEMLSAIEQKMEADEISQAEVARRIGALRHNINQVLRGKANASLDFLMGIAESVGLEVELRFKKSKV